jgi:hypothetical protein
MAALDFPASPSVNDTYAANGKTWRWKAHKTFPRVMYANRVPPFAAIKEYK